MGLEEKEKSAGDRVREGGGICSTPGRVLAFSLIFILLLLGLHAAFNSRCEPGMTGVFCGRRCQEPLHGKTDEDTQQATQASMHLDARHRSKAHTEQLLLSQSQSRQASADRRTVQSSEAAEKVDPCPACAAGTAYDAVVVGGGISGLYSAWRLKNHSAASRVVVLEASSRFGGRISSLHLPGMPQVVADLGAMHYLEDDASVQAHLIKRVLRLTGVAFPTNSSDPRLPFVLRGRRLTAAQLGSATAIGALYALTAAERALYAGPGSLYEHYVRKLVPAYDNVTVDPWTERTSDGRLLKDLGWLELAMLAGMSDEAMHLIIDSSGFADFWDNPNAAALAVQHTTFLHASEYKTFAGGMQDVVAALVALLESLGVELRLDAPVSGLVKCGAYEKVLTGGGAQLCAKQVVLALPRTALQDVAWSGLRESSAWQSVTPVHAMKLYLGYDRPWWRQPPTSSPGGWLYTSMPIQQVLYLGSQADHAAGRTQENGNNTNSLLMAMYCTEQFTTIWESLSRSNASLEVFRGRPNPFAANTEPPIVETGGRPVTMEMLELVRHQLAELHDLALEDVPEPYTAALVDWPAAWHWWKPGANASALSRAVSQLSDDEAVFIVGEAYSDLQGWVQGALSNTERVLSERMHLPPLPGVAAGKRGVPTAPNLWHDLRFARRFRGQRDAR